MFLFRSGLTNVYEEFSLHGCWLLFFVLSFPIARRNAPIYYYPGPGVVVTRSHCTLSGD